MRIMFFITILSAFVLTEYPTQSWAGNCDYSYQTAKNGSRCGARARSARKASSYAQ